MLFGSSGSSVIDEQNPIFSSTRPPGSWDGSLSSPRQSSQFKLVIQGGNASGSCCNVLQPVRSRCRKLFGRAGIVARSGASIDRVASCCRCIRNAACCSPAEPVLLLLRTSDVSRAAAGARGPGWWSSTSASTSCLIVRMFCRTTREQTQVVREQLRQWSACIGVSKLWRPTEVSSLVSCRMELLHGLLVV